MAVALTHLKDRTIAVFGLARSGLATVRAARDGGAAKIWAWDDKPAAHAAAETAGATIAAPGTWPWNDIACLVLAPGVPLTHPEPNPVVGLARAAGVEIICDIELLFRQAEGVAKFVAVTGTNGKSTATALIGHILGAAGMDVAVGGNIGTAALDLRPPRSGLVYVLELSSYQLDLTRRFRPDIAVWLNLTPDHLDRHGDMAGYQGAKEKIFANMRSGDHAVIGVDDVVSRDLAGRVGATEDGPGVTTVSVDGQSDSDIFVDEHGVLHEQGEVASGAISDLSGFTHLRGAHNWQNAACAWGAVRCLGLERDAAAAAMATFPGLAHRMEIFAQRGRVLFVNDSKATNGDAAARALATFDPVYWIAGGQAKTGGIEKLADYFPKIAKAYLIGEAADAFSATLARQVPHVLAGDLAAAVRLAAADAALDDAEEPVVLLSPASASFDQFADFEARGDAFRQAVAALETSSNKAQPVKEALA
jgi:UDP-N-acetylmuramoylalanine--D-glutamate ligase